MIADYDAGAIADVLGVAFIQRLDAGSAPDAWSAKVATSATEGFFIAIGDVSVQVVDTTTISTHAQIALTKDAANPVTAVTIDRLKAPSSVLIEKAVENGLPRLALRHVAERLAGANTAKISAFEWGIVPKTTLERRQEQLSLQESERTERVARLFVHARRALGTEEEARQFLTAPHPQLDGRSPLEAAKTDLGTRRTEQILTALEYGLAL